MDQQTIINDLRALGIGRQYLGYHVTIQAVEMVLEDENRLLCIKQGVFVPLAEEQQCDWRTVERNIRTIIHRAWTVNRPYLSELAGYPLQQEPTVTEFVEILSAHLLRQNEA
ncbi:MAG: sporulation initiation factor Spo0A C-terminal domain-containing protein [Clostridiales bacterium]|nr:sporulation initiation factor Spo0A C-terminal domain-containing protein [Clostridiales bacterium]